MPKIRVSTDSTADLPLQVQQELDIAVLPLSVLAEGREYRDGLDITPDEFYPILDRADPIPVSAQVPVAAYTRLFEDTWAAGYTHLLHVAINAKGSGTYQAGLTALDLFFEDHPEARDQLHIRILDSANYSMGYGLAVMEAARMVREGETDPAALLARTEDLLRRGRVLFIPLDLKFVKKSGRVSAAAAFVGDALGLKPIITFQEGESKILSKVRGETKALEAMVELFAQERDPEAPFVLARGSNAAALEALRTVTAPVGTPLFQFPLGCVITINSGHNAVGLCYIAK